MRNYYAYFVITALILLSGLFASLYALMFLGGFQLLTGIYLLNNYKSYPIWVQKGIGIYWLISISYFIPFLFNLDWIPFVDALILIWLLIVPLSIAIYQFQLIVRMAKLRKRQLEKRSLIQLYGH